MDGTKDSLTVFGELTEEEKNIPGGLRIETRGGFVKEKKEGRLSDELDTDGETFPLFNIKTCK